MMEGVLITQAPHRNPIEFIVKVFLQLGGKRRDFVEIGIRAAVFGSRPECGVSAEEDGIGEVIVGHVGTGGVR